MSHDQPARMPLTSISDLLAAVPYLIGFHPADSIVTVGLTGTRITVAARADLPHPTDTTWVRQVTPQQLSLLRNVDAAEAILVGYGPAATVTPAIGALTGALRAGGVIVLDALRVTDNRYYSYLCDQPLCCPPDGVPFDAHYSRTAARAVFAGQTALPDRAAVVASLAPTAGAAMAEASRRAQERALAARTSGGRTALLRAGDTATRSAAQVYAAGGVLTDDEVAWLCVLLHDDMVRDLAAGATDGEPWQLAMWTDLTRRADAAYASAPAALLALTAWRQGLGVLAAIAIDRAYDADPHYRLAQLIDQALRLGIPPSVFDDDRPTEDPAP